MDYTLNCLFISPQAKAEHSKITVVIFFWLNEEVLFTSGKSWRWVLYEKILLKRWEKEDMFISFNSQSEIIL